MQQNKLLIIIVVIALGAGGYFFWQNTVLNGQLANFKNEKSKVETELAVLKATDFIKKAELLQLKLTNTEKDLEAATKRKTELETNLNKIRPYTDATAAIERFFSAPFTQKGLTDIDTKISVLQDMEVSNRWMTAKVTVDFANNGWGPHDFFQTIFLLNSRIKSLLP